MVTIPLANPYETRVLPAAVSSVPRAPTSLPLAPQARVAPRPPVSAVRLRLALRLQGDDWLEMWDDRIVTRDHIFALDESFNAEVTPDWRAPLTVEARLGLALRDERGRWNIYVPQTEEQIWQAVSTLRDICTARGLRVPDLEPDMLAEDVTPVQRRNPPASMPVRPFTESRAQTAPTPGKHGYDHENTQPHTSVSCRSGAWTTAEKPTTQPTGAVASAPTTSVGMTADTVLAAIVHLSVLFLPVILPMAVWLALRRNAPWVAGQAREAARYQALVWCLGVLLLGIATLAMLVHGIAVATVGLLAFITLIAAASVYAFYAVLRAANDIPFGYLDFLRRAH